RTLAGAGTPCVRHAARRRSGRGPGKPGRSLAPHRPGPLAARRRRCHAARIGGRVRCVRRKSPPDRSRRVQEAALGLDPLIAEIKSFSLIARAQNLFVLCVTNLHDRRLCPVMRSPLIPSASASPLPLPFEADAYGTPTGVPFFLQKALS